MTKSEIRQLAERIASGTATDEEIRLYNEMYNSLLPLKESEWSKELLGDKESLQAEMWSAIRKKTGVEKKHTRVIWIKRMAVAAVVLGVLIVGSVLFYKDGKKVATIANSKQQEERFRNDVAPGQNGAILTLSDGKTIVLDTANNGSLAEEHGTEITKKNGQISYNHQSGGSAVLYNTMTTPRGRQFKLVLADGSRVWLNAESSITYPTAFAGKERKVSVTGEAYFEIAHNPQMPFIVEKGEVRVQVLGTHFNFNSYEDENSIDVTLLEGALKVSRKRASGLIRPGQQAQVKEREIKLINDADINTVMAWKNGLFVFKGRDINALMKQLSRWYDVEVVYDKKVDDLFYATVPRNTNLSDLLKALEFTGKVKFEIINKTIHVTS